ncbi:RAMP-like triterpene glycoside receptor [Danio rerio]|uniref:RAMP-like triterpene glycoside receptor n=1 Tax=Danio rerio TaxID=7955 RepID=D7FB54_DANRE|nr:RAMP-like triterpene glycoside receptor [Danio rerio]CBD35693.1 RAMP-like triterpene glycoside receptor [Danio rerio]|eukprot:NP_001181917.1 RAMP-like triterpene glycoside receptor [Danio rerio]
MYLDIIDMVETCLFSSFAIFSKIFPGLLLIFSPHHAFCIWGNMRALLKYTWTHFFVKYEDALKVTVLKFVKHLELIFIPEFQLCLYELCFSITDCLK